jgi:hypothetical protein
MRKLIYAGLALASIFLHSCGPTHVVVETPVQAPPPPPPPPPAPEVSYQSFYDALSPYGQWIDNPQYGYVWMPNVGPDFKPYASNGNWVYTDGGWMWSSNYPWGWATFHYGRWFFEDGYGWMWIPGNEWAPAWVSWRQSSDYYGWAPLGPSVSISVSFGGGYNPPPHYWNFVPQQYVTSPHVNNYYVSEQQNVTIINNTTVIRNTTIVNNTVNNTTIVNNNVSNTHVTVNNYAGGPDPQEVARVTGTPLRPVTLRESNTPGESMGNGSVAIYRPKVNTPPAGGTTTRFAPTHVQTLNNIHPVNTTVYNTSVTNNTATNNTTSNNNTYNNNSRNTNTVNTTNTTNNNANTNVNKVVNNSNSNTSVNNGQPAATRPAPIQQQVQAVSRPAPGTGSVAGKPAPPKTYAASKPAPKKVPPPPVKKKKPVPKKDDQQQ